MRESYDLLRFERRGRIFFFALAQSALGTGAGYIALLLVAEDRFSSPWAISLVLIADLIPAMLLGPLLGAVADRWSRKYCAIAGDLVRAAAIVGIVLVDSIEATVAFALLAGVGTAMFTPAALAALPSVVDDQRRLPAATALYGAVADVGFTLGPALAAVVLVLGGTDTLLWANAATFLVSGLVLVPLRFGAAPDHPSDTPRPTLLAETRDGLRATAGMPMVRVVLLASAGALFAAGLFSIAELFYATDELGVSEAAFSVLVTCYGAGFIMGSLAGSKGGPAPTLTRRYLAGVAILGLGFVATGATDLFVVALATFTFAGFGNGLLLVYERLLIQEACPDSLFGRVFGIKDALGAWAFALAFLAGGALVSTIGADDVILISGCGCLVVAVVAAIVLRGRWRGDAVEDAPGAELKPVGESVGG
jgi:MFS family permease